MYLTAILVTFLFDLSATLIAVIRVRKLYIVSECMVYRLVNPLVNSSISIALDYDSEIVATCIVAPITEELIFRFLPALAYFYGCTVLPFLMCNIAWIVGHYMTVRDIVETGNSDMLTMFMIYALYAIAFSIPCMLLFNINPALAYLVPVALHAMNNIIAVRSDRYRAKSRLCKDYGYWRVRL